MYINNSNIYPPTLKASTMSTSVEVSRRAATVQFARDQIDQAVSLHLNATALCWLGADIDSGCYNGEIEVTVDGNTHSMFIAYLEVSMIQVDAIVLHDFDISDDSHIAVTLLNGIEGWVAMQTVFYYQQGDAPELPSIGCFL